MGSKYENLLDAGTRNVVQSFYDNFQKSNAGFRNRAGFRMKVIREALGECCEWCSDLEGTYDYDSAPADIWARHKNCSCMVITRTERGTYQDAWSRKEFDSQKEARIARAKEIEIENTQKNVSGGRISDPYSEYAQRWAKSYYEEIRHKSTDCQKIAARLGIDQKDVEKVKEYLFFSGEWYNDITGEYEKFSPDAAIAQSWQRLSEGKEILQHDRTLIEHELYEMQVKEKNPGISHEEAHLLATKKYDYQSQADRYYGDIRKRKIRKRNN